VGRALAIVGVLALGVGAGLAVGWGGRPHSAGAAVAAAQRQAVVRHAATRPKVVRPKAVTHAKPAARRSTPCAAGFEQRVGNDRVAYAAYVRSSAVAYRAPGKTPLATFGSVNANHYAMVFGIVGAVAGKGCKAAWYRVEPPMRPNQTYGYVRAADVLVRRVTTRLEIDLSQRRVTLYRSGRPVLRTTAAIGTSSTPTPIGRYYVNQLLRPSDPSGPFGPAAIGVSAFSPVLQGWVQGGPIGIHGTNQPYLLGQQVSHGCVRVSNAAITELFALVPAGTPVVIHP
jgi:lipoprotein-anchoring transpeptidase ErfK/SrfK